MTTACSTRIMEKYLHLDLYPDANAALAALRGRKLAILSNGSTDMLNALVRNSGLDRVLDATISIDSRKIFKPSPDAYTLIEEKLGVTPAEVLFVSSNPWDAMRRQGLWPQRRLDRTGDAGSDGAGLRQERRRPALDDVQGDPDADGRTRARARLSHPRAVGIAEGRCLIHEVLKSVRAFFAEKAPDITVIESTQSSATVVLAAEAYGVEPARIAKTLSLRVGERVVLIVASRHLADGQQEGEGAVRRQAEDARAR